MLNAKSLSMLKTAEPWSPGAGRHGMKRHKKVHPASMAQVEKFLFGNTTEAKHPQATTTTTTTTTKTAKSVSTTKPAQKEQKAPNQHLQAAAGYVAAAGKKTESSKVTNEKTQMLQGDER